MSSNPSAISARTESLRKLLLFCYYGLIVALLLDSLNMTTALSLTTFIIWILRILPLSLFAPVLHRGNSRGCAWLSFVVLMYFVYGVLVAFTPGRLLVGLLEIGFCAALFAALILFIRSKARDTRSGQD